MKKCFFLIPFISLLIFSCNSFPEKKTNSIESADGKEWISDDGYILIFSGDSCFSSTSGSFYKFSFSNDSVFVKTRIHNLLWKFKIPNDSLIIIPGYSMSRNPGDDMNPTIFHEARKIISPTSFLKNISYVSLGCYGPCPTRDFEIDSAGNFYYDGHGFTKNEGEWEGSMPKYFANEFKNLFEKCTWKKYVKHYSDDWTDQESEALSITFSDKNNFSVYDYGGNSPKELRSLFNYMASLATLADDGYFQKKKSNKNHIYDSELAARDHMEDSIFYMRKFDSLNYREPKYIGGENLLTTIISHNIHKELANKLSYPDNRFWIHITIDPNGVMRVLDTGTKRNFSNKNLGDTLELINKDILNAFSKLGRFTPGMYNGKTVPVNMEIIVNYGSE